MLVVSAVWYILQCKLCSSQVNLVFKNFYEDRFIIIVEVSSKIFKWYVISDADDSESLNCSKCDKIKDYCICNEIIRTFHQVNLML